MVSKTGCHSQRRDTAHQSPMPPVIEGVRLFWNDAAGRVVARLAGHPPRSLDTPAGKL